MRAFCVHCNEELSLEDLRCKNCGFSHDPLVGGYRQEPDRASNMMRVRKPSWLRRHLMPKKRGPRADIYCGHVDHEDHFTRITYHGYWNALEFKRPGYTIAVCKECMLKFRKWEDDYRG